MAERTWWESIKVESHQLVNKVKELIEEGNLVSGKLMLRFLAGLSRIVEGQGVMEVIGELVSKIEGQQPNALYHEEEILILGEDG